LEGKRETDENLCEVDTDERKKKECLPNYYSFSSFFPLKEIEYISKDVRGHNSSGMKLSTFYDEGRVSKYTQGGPKEMSNFGEK
jgi:hypothetical protein